MGFFDNLKKTAEGLGATIKEGASQAADKAKDLAETAKQKAAISEAERKIKDVYTDIGKSFFEQFPDKAKELFPEQLGKIDEFKAVIENAKAAIAALGDKVEEKAEEVKAEAAEVAEEVKEKAEEVKEKVEEAVEQIN